MSTTLYPFRSVQENDFSILQRCLDKAPLSLKPLMLSKSLRDPARSSEQTAHYPLFSVRRVCEDCASAASFFPSMEILWRLLSCFRARMHMPFNLHPFSRHASVMSQFSGPPYFLLHHMGSYVRFQLHANNFPTLFEGVPIH
jgi:hypothetical protein